MIRLLSDMPHGVLGLEAVGKARLVYVLGHEFDEYEADAVWEDVELGVRHPGSFARIGR
jgi:hypothetical protein